MATYERWIIFFLCLLCMPALPWVLRTILSQRAKRRGISSLRPLIKVFGILCWALWIASCFYFFRNTIRPGKFATQGFVFLTVYMGVLTVFHWLRRETEFEDVSVGSSVSSLVLRFPSETYVGVGSPEELSDWYVSKLGMRRLAARVAGAVALKFNGDGQSLTLEPRDKFYARGTPILYTTRISKAKSVLVSRGIQVGDIQTDRQGTRYFEIRDSEGNLIEVSEEPAGGLGGEIL